MTPLQQSIAKWQSIVDGTGSDDGIRDCALCAIYVNNKCRGCPVFEKTKHIRCGLTPYDTWYNYQQRCRPKSKSKKLRVFDATSLKFARAELEFLQILESKNDI